MNFWILPAIHFLALMSPGPDFFFILQYSILYSRRISLISTIGIACGCLVHMFTVIILIFILGNQVEWIEQALKILGSGYLIFMGISSLLASFKKKSSDEITELEEITATLVEKERKGESIAESEKKLEKTDYSSYFLKGFLCNVLNPKAWAYFSSIFIVIHSQFSTTKMLLAVFLFFIITIAWFCLVVVLFTLPKIKSRLEGYKSFISFISGFAFCFLGISLALN